MSDLDNMVQLPVYDIPMMSDERWQELARENAVHNYRREFGRESASVEETVEWQRKRSEAREPKFTNTCEAMKAKGFRYE